ncbi:uncharacterized protein LOC126742663 isoform X2 [Anthonomus grandis grandis]|uniref:uncharacterized protein LOC126742663 isoform X2 n=1 Tax=Anthonomus grandis grandis TaxID=2921223 RepID=UPI002166B187|nr:uncharacterized protein LOC126742663 isoform X2 [Anthonomus grandis grandis]
MRLGRNQGCQPVNINNPRTQTLHGTHRYMVTHYIQQPPRDKLELQEQEDEQHKTFSPETSDDQQHSTPENVDGHEATIDKRGLSNCEATATGPGAGLENRFFGVTVFVRGDSRWTCEKWGKYAVDVEKIKTVQRRILKLQGGSLW